MIGRMSYPRLVDEVQPDRHAVVEASAGTGKTYALAHLVADLVLRRGVPQERIVVVTFTEKATSELSQRIRSVLTTAALGTRKDPAPGWTLDAATRARAEEALLALDTAPIETIHAFARRILREEAFLAGRPFAEDVVDGRRLFREAFHQAIRGFAPGSAGARALADALETLSLQEVEAAVFDASRLPDVAASPSQPSVGYLALAGELETAVASSIDAKPPWPLVRSSVRRALAAERDDVRDAAFAEALTAVRALKKPARAALSKPERVLEKILVQGAPVVPARERVPEVVRALLPEVLAVREAMKARGRLVDFDDLLSHARGAVVGPHGDEIAARLRTRFHHAFIDEFQDTDDCQWELFERVFVRGGDRRLVVIGDPKQAIYGFRGADVFTYLAARDALLRGGATRHHLTDNWRSSPGLFAAVERLLDDAADPAILEGLVRYDHPGAAKGTSRDAKLGKKAAPPLVVFRVAGQKVAAADAKLAVLQAVGDELEKVVLPGRLVGSHGRPVRPAECMILTYTGLDAERAATHLESRGIPAALVRHEDIFLSREAEDVRALLAHVADAGDPSLLRRALATSFFGVPLHEVGAFEPGDTSHPATQVLATLTRLARTRRWADFARVAKEDSRFVARELFVGTGGRRTAVVAAILDTLAREAQRVSLGAREVLDLAIALREGRARVTEPAVPDKALGEADAVRILTVHKSKGLEAELVFLVGVGSTRPTRFVPVHVGHRRVRGFREDPLTDEKHQREQADERARLAYVALTRARSRLYLHLSDDRMRRVTPYAPIADAVRRVLASPDETSGVETRVVAVPRPGALPPRQEALALPVGWPEREPDPEPMAFREGPGLLSYSLLAGVGRGVVGDAKADLGFAAGAGDAGDVPGGLRTGRAVHEILEALPLAPFVEGADDASLAARDDVRAILADVGFRHALSEEVTRALLGLAARTLRLPPLAGFPSLARCVVARELEITLPGAPAELPAGLFASDRDFLRSVLDALVLHEGRALVVDYKSDVLPGYDLARTRPHTEAAYAVQARLYRLAARRALAAAGVDVPDPDVAFLYVRAAETDDGRVVVLAPPASEELLS